MNQIVDCSKKKNLSHNKWVAFQFKCRLIKIGNKFEYKDVFLHTSFLEGLIVDKSLKEHPFPATDEELTKNPNHKRGFRSALELLKAQLGEEYKLLHKLYDDRNQLIHNITRCQDSSNKNGLDQKEIEEIRDRMGKHAIEIYQQSDYIDRLFQEKDYGFSPKNELTATPIGVQESTYRSDTT